jgi:hypothetical protein
MHTHPRQPPGPAAFWALPASLLIAAGFLVLLISVSNLDKVRYQKQNDDAYTAIFGHNGPVDVAFGGTSRTRRGIYAPFLAPSLAPYFGGRAPVIYDLAISGWGADAQIRVLLDLLDRRPVKTIFFHSYHLPMIDPPTHPRIRTLGTIFDILRAPIKNWPLDISLTHRSQLLYQRLAAALDTCLDPKDPFYCLKAPDPIPAQSVDTSWPRLMHVERQLEVMREREEKRGGNYFRDEIRQWDFDDGNDHRTGYYLDLLIQKARNKGTTVVLVDYPEYGDLPLAKGFPEQVSRRFGVDYLYLDRQPLLFLGETGFGDSRHVNIRGEKTIRDMIERYFASKPPVDGENRYDQTAQSDAL